MTNFPVAANSAQLIARIDTIIRELQDLRQHLSMTRPSPLEMEALIRELRGKYATGRSLTQALLDERRRERQREDAKFHRPSQNG
jgi:hypothetical protein